MPSFLSTFANLQTSRCSSAYVSLRVSPGSPSHRIAVRSPNPAARLRSRQLYETFVLPPANHWANGSFQTSALSNGLNQCNSLRARSAQNFGGSAAAWSQSCLVFFERLDACPLGELLRRRKQPLLLHHRVDLAAWIRTSRHCHFLSCAADACSLNHGSILAERTKSANLLSAKGLAVCDRPEILPSGRARYADRRKMRGSVLNGAFGTPYRRERSRKAPTCSLQALVSLHPAQAPHRAARTRWKTSRK